MKLTDMMQALTEKAPQMKKNKNQKAVDSIVSRLKGLESRSSGANKRNISKAVKALSSVRFEYSVLDD